MSEMPDFEPTTPPINEYPAPKKPRKKPTRRTKREKKMVVTVASKRKVAKRRGRPAGVPNKPKVVELSASPMVAGQAAAVLVVLEVLARYPSEIRKEILDRAKALA